MKYLSYGVTSMLFLLLITACGGQSAGVPAEVAAGQEIYETGGASGVPCMSCHLLNSEHIGPSVAETVANAANRVPGQSAEDYIAEAITNPAAYIVEGYADGVQMPSTYVESLSEDDINNLVLFILAQGQ